MTSSSITPKKVSSSEEEIIVPLLARQSCHLPGNTWTQDWLQYMENRHILFGICLHHPLHPLESWERILALFGSVAFGLAATTYCKIWDYYDRDNMNDIVFTVYYMGNYYITRGMIVLWTIGGLGHAMFDICVWNIMACACCHAGGRFASSEMAPRCKDCGSYSLIPVVLAVMGIAVFLVLARVSIENDNDDDDDGTESNGDDEGGWRYFWNSLGGGVGSVDGVQQFSFLLEYCIEITLAWLVYFPVMGTLMFSGVLGCNGLLPVLGGRPRDKRLVEEELGTYQRGPGQRYARMV